MQNKKNSTIKTELIFQLRTLFKELEEAEIKQPMRSSSILSSAYTSLAEVQALWCSAQ